MALTVFAGETDTIFTHKEYSRELEDLLKKKQLSDVLHMLPGGHSAVASRSGQLQLKMVANWLKKQ